jgi:RNA polymerase sigma-70 factor (ECF subfamily)
LIDIGLIEECRGGNLTNFRKLVGATSPFVFSVAFRMTGDEDLAKDIVQETMITIWQKLKKIRSSEGYKVWVYRIAINKCYDHLRRIKRNPESVADDLTWARLSNRLSEMQVTDMENAEIAGIINLLTDRLSPKQKAVFVLSDLEDMTAEEISGITGMSRTTIKANLHYARKSISQMVEKYI